MKIRALIALSSAALLTLVFSLASIAGPGVCSDPDGDGICDSAGNDNCTSIANPDQRDDDEDGYGNVCDEDVTQDCIIGAPDVAPTFSRLFDSSPWTPKRRGAYDVTGDGIVGAPDVAQIFGKLFQGPGPTSRACADCLAAPGAGVCP